LPLVVVLPEPCSPTIMIFVGGTGGERDPRLPSIAQLQHLDDLLTRRDSSSPSALLDEELARDLVVDVRLQQTRRISRSPSLIMGSVSTPR
jgi:hypothetical protein